MTDHQKILDMLIARGIHYAVCVHSTGSTIVAYNECYAPTQFEFNPHGELMEIK